MRPTRPISEATPSPGEEELLDRALAFWQPRTERVLTREDARQIVENVTNFFCLLARWERQAIAGTGPSDESDNRTG